MKVLKIFFVVIPLFFSFSTQAQWLQISENRRFLIKEDSIPFFWLGDTAWELFHKLDLNEAERYFRNRAAKGFNVIQAVLLGEINGLTEPNANGDIPLVNLDPARPNEKYFAYVDHIVRLAASYGLYMAILPNWGAHVEDKPHVLFENLHVFTPENAAIYGEFLGKRYKDQWNIIWILGGDRPPTGHESIWHAMAAGLQEGDADKHLISYHPMGGMTSSEWFHTVDWLDFNMLQSGHARLFNNNYDMIAHDYALNPPKPVLDGEPNYEELPSGFQELGQRFTDVDVRRAAYWAVFAGAFGHTYGHNAIWQMAVPEKPSYVWTQVSWQKALDFPGSFQLVHLKRLMLSRPFLTRIPDQNLLLDGPGMMTEHQQATRDGMPGNNDATYIMVYSPVFRNIRVNTSAIAGEHLRTWWYDPQNGLAYPLGEFENTGEYSPGGNERIQEGMGGPDWVLVIDDAAQNYPPPGEKCP